MFRPRRSEPRTCRTGRLRHVVLVRRVGRDRLGPRALEVDAALSEFEGVDPDAGFGDLLVQVVVQRALDLVDRSTGDADAPEIELCDVDRD